MTEKPTTAYFNRQMSMLKQSILNLHESHNFHKRCFGISKASTVIQNFTILSSAIPALDTKEENYWHVQFIPLAVKLETTHKPAKPATNQTKQTSQL